MTDQEFTSLEFGALVKLLEDGDRRFSTLRKQLQYCHVKKRESTGVGFFLDLEVPRSVVRACAAGEKLRLGDVEAHIKGLENGAGFVLFVSNGYLDVLEGFSCGESWPKGQITEFTVYSIGD